MKLLKNLIAFVLAFIVISTAVDWWRGRGIPQGTLEETWLPLVSGEQVELIKKSHDEPVIVYFWATWCSVCTYVSPSVNWLASDYPVVSVAIRSGTDERLQHYLHEKDYRFDTVNDETGQLSAQWQVRATPTIAIVHRGEIVSYTTGISTPIGLWLRRWWASI